ADEAVSRRVLPRPVDLDHAAALHGDREAAGIGTIERACCVDDRGWSAKRNLAPGRPIRYAIRWCSHIAPIPRDVRISVNHKEHKGHKGHQGRQAHERLDLKDVPPMTMPAPH